MSRRMKFDVLANGGDGKHHELLVEASCFVEAGGNALRELPPESEIYYMTTVQNDRPEVAQQP